MPTWVSFADAIQIKMKIYLTDQRKYFYKHFLNIKTYDIIPYQKESLRHKTNQQRIDCPFSNLSFSPIFNYNIFPSNILTSYPQWLHENRKIQPNDIIVQQINIPPIKSFAQRIIVGVRIKDVYDSNACKGFSYETLHGHVEKGISIFKIEPQDKHSIFTIETHSAPAGGLLNLLSSLSSLYQNYCTKEALNNLSQTLSS